MDSKQASVIVGCCWKDLLIANWFSKNWFEETYSINLTEKQYKDIVALYNDSNMPDIITREIKEWVFDNSILKEFE